MAPQQSQHHGHPEADTCTWGWWLKDRGDSKLSLMLQITPIFDWNTFPVFVLSCVNLYNTDMLLSHPGNNYQVVQFRVIKTKGQMCWPRHTLLSFTKNQPKVCVIQIQRMQWGKGEGNCLPWLTRWWWRQPPAIKGPHSLSSHDLYFKELMAGSSSVLGNLSKLSRQIQN